jgi:hypothetical protein
MKKCLLIFLFLLSACASTSEIVEEMKPTKIEPRPEDRQYLQEALACPLEFTLPKEQEKDAWGRAQSWVGRFSSMKLDTLTDYVIETYGAYSRSCYSPAYAYRVTKAPMKDSIQINVASTTNCPGVAGESAIHNAHILSYYIKTRELRAYLVYR